jgi:hypothetical protein
MSPSLELNGSSTKAAEEGAADARAGWAAYQKDFSENCPAENNSESQSPGRSSTIPLLVLADEPTGATRRRGGRC